MGRSIWNSSNYQVEPREQGGAGSRSPHPAEPRVGRRSAPAAPGPACGAPCPRRNHGFAPHLRSGADAEAILLEARAPTPEKGSGRPRLLFRAAASRETVTSPAGPAGTPPPPRPLRIRRRSDTRSPRPTPGHVSSSPGGPRAFGRTKGPGTPRGP